jgi:hypothetical protein
MTEQLSTEGLTYTAFSGHRRITGGGLSKVLPDLKRHLDGGGDPILIFEDQTGRQVDFDFRGTADDVVSRASGSVKTGPGRPRLGVVSREVSLLPRQWEWLESQPNGISASIRRLVDDARHNETGIQRGRHVRDAAGKFMWALAGDLPQFEDATRALFARDDAKLAERIAEWPADIREHVLRLAADASELEGW